MNLRKKLLRESCLYAIVDKNIQGVRPVLDIVNRAKKLGVDIIQLRDKKSSKENILKDAFILSKLLSKTKTLFIINDYLDIAKILNCDGIHLGQDDIPVEIARQILGKDKIIGISCHNLKQALKAQKDGADYISIGPIFSTPVKPGRKAIGLDLIKKCIKLIRIPFFAVGGINQKTINKVLSSGAKRIAICRAIYNDSIRIRKK